MFDPLAMYLGLGNLSSLCFFFSHSAQINITAGPGQNVTLHLGAANNIKYVLVTKLGKEKDGYVLLYRDGQCETDHQLLSFKTRVELKKDGNSSLILMKVKTADNGTYKLEIYQGEPPTLMFHLCVDPAGEICFFTVYFLGIPIFDLVLLPKALRF